MQIAQSLSFQIGFLITLHSDSVLKGGLVSLIAIDRVPVIEVNVKVTGRDAVAFQFHIHGLQIALSPVPDFKAEPDRPFLAVVEVEIRVVQTGLFKICLVEVGKVVQRMNAASLFGPAFPEFDMKMGIGSVFLSHRADQLALLHLFSEYHTLRDAVEMNIEKKQVILSILRIDDLENHMS